MQLTAMSYSERLAFIEVDSGLSGDTVSVSASPRCFVGTDNYSWPLAAVRLCDGRYNAILLVHAFWNALDTPKKGKQVCEHRL